jgi:hypothetical protein
MIEGDFEQRFERYLDKLLGYGHFKLSCVKQSEDYKSPTWLNSIF